MYGLHWRLGCRERLQQFRPSSNISSLTSVNFAPPISPLLVFGSSSPERHHKLYTSPFHSLQRPAIRYRTSSLGPLFCKSIRFLQTTPKKSNGVTENGATLDVEHSGNVVSKIAVPQYVGMCFSTP